MWGRHLAGPPNLNQEKFTMILKSLVSALLVLGGFVAGTTIAPQDGQDADKMKEMMEKYMQAAQPGEQHAMLAALEGAWQQSCDFSTPGSPSQVTPGKAVYRSILGGRFVTGETRAKLAMPGMAEPQDWQAFSILGYDNVLKQYQSVWIDSMGTGIYTSSGTADASGKVITLDGVMKDAMTPAGRAFKVVINMADGKKRVTELWDSMGGKDMVKCGVITETRTK
jgi:hypothetical protein